MTPEAVTEVGALGVGAGAGELVLLLPPPQPPSAMARARVLTELAVRGLFMIVFLRCCRILDSGNYALMELIGENIPLQFAGKIFPFLDGVKICRLTGL